jgi:hypothetical protein
LLQTQGRDSVRRRRIVTKEKGKHGKYLASSKSNLTSEKRGGRTGGWWRWSGGTAAGKQRAARTAACARTSACMLCSVAAACLRTRYPRTRDCSFTSALSARSAFFACHTQIFTKIY